MRGALASGTLRDTKINPKYKPKNPSRTQHGRAALFTAPTRTPTSQTPADPLPPPSPVSQSSYRAEVSPVGSSFESGTSAAPNRNYPAVGSRFHEQFGSSSANTDSGSLPPSNIANAAGRAAFLNSFKRGLVPDPVVTTSSISRNNTVGPHSATGYCRHGTVGGKRGNDFHRRAQTSHGERPLQTDFQKLKSAVTSKASAGRPNINRIATEAEHKNSTDSHRPLTSDSRGTNKSRARSDSSSSSKISWTSLKDGVKQMSPRLAAAFSDPFAAMRKHSERKKEEEVRGRLEAAKAHNDAQRWAQSTAPKHDANALTISKAQERRDKMKATISRPIAVDRQGPNVAIVHGALPTRDPSSEHHAKEQYIRLPGVDRSGNSRNTTFGDLIDAGKNATAHNGVPPMPPPSTLPPSMPLSPAPPPQQKRPINFSSVFRHNPSSSVSSARSSNSKCKSTDSDLSFKCAGVAEADLIDAESRKHAGRCAMCGAEGVRITTGMCDACSSPPWKHTARFPTVADRKHVPPSPPEQQRTCDLSTLVPPFPLSIPAANTLAASPSQPPPPPPSKHPARASSVYSPYRGKFTSTYTDPGNPFAQCTSSPPPVPPLPTQQQADEYTYRDSDDIGEMGLGIKRWRENVRNGEGAGRDTGFYGFYDDILAVSAAEPRHGT